MRHRLTDGHPDNFLLVNVGRQSPEKGLKEIRDHLFPMPGLRLALVGGGPSHEQLKEHYRATPTVFPGYLRGADLVAAYRAADAFILPSTTETFGLVALEAMACGLPVIAAQAGGVVDTIQHGCNGFFYNPAHLAEIRPLVQGLQEAPKLRSRMAQDAIAHAQSRSWRATMDQLVDYYRLALRVHRFSGKD
jgi:glycosyltransferase involved in cell wall biosynthesis